jgi:hypothetical protein
LGVGWEQGRDWRDINEVLKRDPLSIPIHTIFAGQYGAVFTQGRGSGWAHSHYNSHTGNAPCVQWLLLCFSVGGGGGSQRAQPQRNVVSRSRNVDSRVCSRRLRLPLIFFFFAKEKGRVGSHTHTQTLKTKKQHQQEEQEQGRWNLGIHEIFFSKSAHERNLITSTCLCVCVFVFHKFFLLKFMAGIIFVSSFLPHVFVSYSSDSAVNCERFWRI